MALRILIVVNEPWFFVSHRLSFARSALNSGFEVHVATRSGQGVDRIKKEGFIHHLVPVSRSGSNPFSELCSVASLVRLYAKIRPTLVHHITIKPVLYGSLAAILAGVPCVVNMISGLGPVFHPSGFWANVRKFLVLAVYRRLLKRENTRIVFQNPDDLRVLTEKLDLDARSVALIKGSGVDPQQFSYVKEKVGEPIVVFASRLLWNKGVGEFVNAARMIKEQGLSARFVIVGKGDSGSPACVADAQLLHWQKEGAIEWWGHRDDMVEVLARSHILCLPSFYAEGVPKILIEGASCGRPIVTTDAPGCREIVRHGVNGYLVPTKNAAAVASALIKLIKSPDLRQKFGMAGRELVEKEFFLEKVNSETLHVYDEVISNAGVMVDGEDCWVPGSRMSAGNLSTD